MSTTTSTDHENGQESVEATITSGESGGPTHPNDTSVVSPDGTATKLLDSSISSLPRDEPTKLKGLKVLFLSSDTGGGHRASAESLARQFELLFPGSSYDLLDLATEAYLPPYNSIVPYYKHLSAHPTQWKILYGVSNSRAMDRVVETNIKMMTVLCERSIRKRIKAYHPDVVVSVHPLQTSVPILSCAKISHETGKHLPMFTVVTDLGSAHRTWFANGVEKMFVGSSQIYKLARERKIPEDKLVLIGLPIRHDFAVEAEKLGNRMSEEGKAYQKLVRTKLKLPSVDRKTLLVMGGGEGVGSLSNIVDALYIELVKQGVDAVIMVVCGRNETLKNSLEERDWDEVFQMRSTSKATKISRGLFSAANIIPNLSGCGDDIPITAGCIEAGGSFRSLRRILSSGSLRNNDSAVFIPSPKQQKPIIEDEKKEDKHIGEENKKPLSTVNEGVPSNTKNVESSNSDKVEPSASIDSNGNVAVVPLGFITNMAEYMVAADVLISKAGPGTISEAAALSLPVMLTSFLPGQEEGNVDYVVEGGFGAFCQDSDPQAVAEEVALWLNDDQKLTEMSIAAKKCGAPNAARDIVKQIGDSTLKWRELNEGHVSLPADYGLKEEREDLSEIYNEEEQIADFIASQKPSEEISPRSKDDTAI
ncbi:monogalactosyldiacylglycerol synthase family protein [Nitzschia inconspicua]|uniref:monogalactosyldiacylglycerol synthase n=1 Tax=Nitzschia inconspicua TaxID=303405 RepID=A0A9K3LLV6_9STRA|nr:monogalactosyldiacylglycerol synthase family protein [Nitzschia inconspicua]